jgi:uncharacterized RDD family membrane protein YckC
MSREQLDAIRFESAPSAPSAPTAPTAPVAPVAPQGSLKEFDLDESPGSNEVRPPDDFVPGSGLAWQPEPAAPAPPPPPEPVVVPEPEFIPEPASGPKFDRPVASWAEKPPGDGDATFAEINYDSRSAVEPPDEASWEPPDIEHSGASFESSWVPGGKREADTEGGFALPAPRHQPTQPQPTQPQPAPPVPAPPPAQPHAPAASPAVPAPAAPASPSAEPFQPAPAIAPVSAAPSPFAPPATPPPSPSTPSFDRPTPPASPPASSFDQPTPAAAPPPALMPREERVAGGAGGLLPSLDDLDGAIAGPEMEMPYQPDPDPTADVPLVTHRRVDIGVGFLLRALATVLDVLWISALTVAAWMVSGENQIVSFAVGLVCSLGIIVGWALWGTSPGKKALGLTVEGKVPSSESGIGFLRAVIRAAGYLVSSLTLGIGFLMIAFSADKRGLHDRIAGTWIRRRG